MDLAPNEKPAPLLIAQAPEVIATPYPHSILQPFCQDWLLEGVRQEMLSHLHFTQKETDILKYHQSGDLANLDGLCPEDQKRLPYLRQLRDALYSEEFRAHVSRLLGCGPLSGTRTDMSTNRYKPGDHLLLHDDVIGDRCVSYIIYLQKTGVGGGRLEMYPRDENWQPGFRPAKQIDAEWNKMVLFRVQPGTSHHSVEEVTDGERLSIQGWFHYPQPNEPGYSPEQMQELWSGGQVSTLAQVGNNTQRHEGKDMEFMEAESEKEKKEEEFTDRDRQHLSRYINEEYLKESTMGQIQQRFVEESHIQLARFLSGPVADQLKALVTGWDRRDGLDRPRVPPHGTAEAHPWEPVGPPVIRRYMRLAQGGAGATLLNELQDLFGSPSYRRWLRRLTTLQLAGVRGSVRRFRSGLDYTLGTPDGGGGGSSAAGAAAQKTVLDSVVTLVDQPEMWQDGSVGGYQCYVDGGETAGSNDGSVCRNDDDSDAILLTVPATWNTLSLVMREPGVVSFTKYVSALAPGSRWDISMEYICLC